MPKLTLATLGVRVKAKRGARKLREVANEIGIGAATLMRIENGRVPDLATFGKICKWLDIDPRPLLGLQSKLEVDEAEAAAVLEVNAHLKLDQNPNPTTVNALAKMILHAAKMRRSTQELPDDGDA
jgi:transcriptional regulator with XRE-family HTH domain